MGCNLCNLHVTCANPGQMGNGKRTARIMVVAEHPLESENLRKQYMTGKAGRMFTAALGEVGIDLDDVYFTSVLKCSTPGDRAPHSDEVKACVESLWAEIEVVKPEIIVPTGNIALTQLMGVTGITKYRGKLVEKDGLKFFPIIHPHMILKQPKWLDTFAKDMINLEMLLRGDFKPLGAEGEERRYCETFSDAIDEIKRLIQLPEGSYVVVDIEANGNNPWKPIAKVGAIGFSDRAGYGSAIPLYMDDTPFTGNQIGTIIKYLRWLFSCEHLHFVGQNGKFDKNYLLEQLDIEIKKFTWDTMLMHYLGVTEEQGTHGLDDFAWQYFSKGGYDRPLEEYKATLPVTERYNYCKIPWDLLKVYLADDCDVTARSLEIFLPIIESNEDFVWIMENIMMPGADAIGDIERNGMKVDVQWLNFLGEKFPEEIARLEEKLHQFPEVLEVEREKQRMWEERCAIGVIKKANRTPEQQTKFEKYKKYDPKNEGNRFNFSSVQQLSDLLFNRLGLKGEILTDKGSEYKKEHGIKKLTDLPYWCFSTKDEALVELAKQHPIADLLQEYRKAVHLHNNFVVSLREHLTPDGLVHPTFNLHGTVTGRLSSDNPNAQQFPRKVNDPLLFQYWHEVKKLFISRFGDEGVVIQFDYSQLELRILAVITGDPELQRLYREGVDLHKDVASKAFGVPIELVSKDQRTAAKKIQFGIVYQESARGLSEDLRAEGINMSEEDCQDFIDKYFKRFPLVKKWVQETKRFVKHNKYVRNMLGRIRHLDAIDSIENGIANQAERQSVNAPIQSTGSDCTMMAIIHINKWLKETKKKSMIMCTVHDSIVLDCTRDEVFEVSRKVKHIMENLAMYNERYSFLGDVPLLAEMEIGYSYGEAYEVSDIDALEKEGIVSFIDTQRAKKKAKEEEAYKKAEDNHKKIPSFVYGYWNPDKVS